MPRGSKKRKAAKKKKTNEPQLHGDDDDLIVHEGKDSDGGDVSSPLSQHPDDGLHAASVGGDDDHDHDDDDDKEEEEEDPPSVRSNVAVENESLVVENGESIVKVTVEEEIPVENSEFENKSTNQDREIHENPSGGGGGGDDDSDSSSSSSSSSDSSDDDDEKKKENIVMEDSIEAVALEMSNPMLLVEQKDEELAESPSLDLDLDLSTKPDDLPAEITQIKSASDVTNVIDLETTPLTSDEPVEIAKVNNNGEIRFKENEINVDKQVSTTVQETTTVTAPVLSSSSVVSTAVTNNVNDQPRVVVTTPKPTQRTSMASCCGLFELFTGSNR